MHMTSYSIIVPRLRLYEHLALVVVQCAPPGVHALTPQQLILLLSGRSRL